jgi:hypothetical protein
MSMAYRMSSGDRECRSDLERPEERLRCLGRTDREPSARGLATSAMGGVAPLTCCSVSPLSNSAMRADRRNEAWLRLRLRCKVVLRDVDLVRDGGGDGLDLFRLLDVLLAGCGFLPRPRCEPLRIDEG